MYQGHTAYNQFGATDFEAVPAPIGVSLPNLSYLHELNGLTESSRWPRVATLVPWAKAEGVTLVDYGTPNVAYSVYALNERLLQEIQRDVTFGNRLPFLAIAMHQRPDTVQLDQALANTPYELERVEAVYSDDSTDTVLEPIWLVWIAASDLGKEGGNRLVEHVAATLNGQLLYALQHAHNPRRRPAGSVKEALAHQERQHSIRRLPAQRIVDPRRLSTYRPTRSVAVGDAATNAIEASKEASKSRYYAALSAAGICAILALALAMDSRKSRK